ncbi:hypothetical protein [Methanobrevibacter millerae]|uniref:Uncharacterized protein n=1 Tax=Methanobrevibacter millerae TaxID=230361 RepID=A0A1G5VKW2_9EURY|nr:hypothetical protein [Methanobrevibacter millerae]SDA45705.1 hypothetical protein SAMN02910315_00649 [Methanobrevibacter millerae]
MGKGLLDSYLLAQALGWNWDFGTMMLLHYVLPIGIAILIFSVLCALDDGIHCNFKVKIRRD